MIPLLAALCVTLIFFGGATSLHGMTLGVAIAGFGAVGLGTLFAASQTGGRVYGFDVQDGITIGQLKSAILPCADDTRVYVGDAGVNVAGSMFECRLDGGRAFVIERRVEETPQATNMVWERPDSLF